MRKYSKQGSLIFTLLLIVGLVLQVYSPVLLAEQSDSPGDVAEELVDDNVNQEESADLEGQNDEANEETFNIEEEAAEPFSEELTGFEGGSQEEEQEQEEQGEEQEGDEDNSFLDLIEEASPNTESEWPVEPVGMQKSGSRGGPTVTYSGALTVKRSEVVDRTFMDYDKWNLNDAWASFMDYALWQKSGIVAMLSKVTINGQSIEPQNGDYWAYTQMYQAMGGSGTTSFTNKLSKVAVLCNKARSVPANLPLSAHPQLIEENTYTAPFTFKTDYSVDYSSYSPLFKNDFILIDDYRQVSFEFAPSADGETHGRFTDPIELLSLGGYQNVKKPNNAVGLVQGQSMNVAGLGIPNYELDEGWEIKEISDGTNVYTENQILNKEVDENITYTIKLHKPRIKVVVPAIWYPVDKDSGEVISGLHPIPTCLDMYPRSEIAKLNEDTDVYDINLAAIPEPLPGSYTENNFNLTASILFTDRFHRVSAQGYNHFTIKPVSSVVKVEYGNEVFEDVSNGIQGATGTPYQEGETMHMYLAVRTPATLSGATLKDGDVTVTNQMTAEEIRAALIGHIEKVVYVDLDQLQQVDLDLNNLDKLFLFRYETGDDGAFIKDAGTGEYINYMTTGFDGLPDGKYEAVFPIYWQYNIPTGFGAADEYVRNRYKLDDTFHFSFTKTSLVDVEGTKKWEDNNNQAGKRPASITITLLADDIEQASKTVTAADDWTWSFTDLPKNNENGEKIIYTIKENPVAGYAAPVITGDAEEGFVVTNRYKSTPEPPIDPADPDPLVPEEETECVVIFKLNGGNFNGSTADVVIICEYGEVISILEAPIREGYEFMYWEGSAYYPGESYTVTGSHTFIARWAKKAGGIEGSGKLEETDFGPPVFQKAAYQLPKTAAASGFSPEMSITVSLLLSFLSK